MPTPEAIAREEIDRQLAAAGWDVQDRREMNITLPKVRPAIPMSLTAKELVLSEMRARCLSLQRWPNPQPWGIL